MIQVIGQAVAQVPDPVPDPIGNGPVVSPSVCEANQMLYQQLQSQLLLSNIQLDCLAGRGDSLPLPGTSSYQAEKVNNDALRNSILLLELFNSLVCGPLVDPEVYVPPPPSPIDGTGGFHCTPLGVPELPYSELLY